MRLQPLDIVLVNTRASELHRHRRSISTAGCGMGREATLYLTSRGVRVAGIDAWGWDAPFVHMRKRWLETRDPSIIWEGHKAGREIPYCHMEKLCNLEQLPRARLHGRLLPAQDQKRLRPAGRARWRCSISLARTPRVLPCRTAPRRRTDKRAR